MNIDRRQFSRSTLAAAAGAGLVRTAWGTQPPAETEPLSCEEALLRLKQGNGRFVRGELRHPHLGSDWRKRLADGQKPFATILGCSDSRVPPELLFDQGFGDLFVIRVAGNVIDTDVTGSIEYGVDHLKTSLVVVMGHEGCGAVTAALQADEDLRDEPNEIRSLVQKIKPATKTVSDDLPFVDRLKASVEANVRESVRRLQSVPDLAAAERKEVTKIIGCVYDIQSGRVRTL
ncbi:MAG: carbonic anhydrase [Planctomycetota bacterium]